MPVASTTSRRLAWGLLWLSLAIHVPIAVVALGETKRMGPDSDFTNYYDIGTRSGRLYADSPVEFPVTAAQTFRALARIAGDRDRFGMGLVLISVAADAAIVAALGWGWGLEAAACYALIAIPLLDLVLLRFDLWPTALATIAVAAWRRERPILAGMALVAGGAFKLWPLMFLPVLLVFSNPRRRIRGVGAAIAAGLALLTEWLWIAGPSGLYQVLTFRGARGWEIESTVGAAWMLVDRTSIRVEAGAWRIGAIVGPTAILLFALGAIPCLWMIGRGARTGRLGAGWAGGISVLLLVSPLLSAQFGIWLAPAGGLAWFERDRRIAVLTGITVFFTNLVFKSFHPLTLGSPRAIAIVLARNVLVALLVADAARVLARAPARESS